MQCWQLLHDLGWVPLMRHAVPRRCSSRAETRAHLRSRIHRGAGFIPLLRASAITRSASTGRREVRLVVCFLEHLTVVRYEKQIVSLNTGESGGGPTPHD